MGKPIRCVEDIEAWQLGIELAERLYRLSDAPKLARDFRLADQMHAAAVSIPSNIAEGFERNSSPADFARFLAYAKGSCGELKTQLIIAQRIGYIPEETVAPLIKLTDRIAAATRRFRETLVPVN